jgi:hypothetical protein
VSESDKLVRNQAAYVMVANMDVTRFAGDGRGGGKVDGRLVVFVNDSGEGLGESYGF